MKSKTSPKPLRVTSVDISYAVQVSREPWRYSVSATKAAISVLEKAGYKNLAETLKDFVIDEKMPW